MSQKSLLVYTIHHSSLLWSSSHLVAIIHRKVEANYAGLMCMSPGGNTISSPSLRRVANLGSLESVYLDSRDPAHFTFCITIISSSSNTLKTKCHILRRIEIFIWTTTKEIFIFILCFTENSNFYFSISFVVRPRLLDMTSD